MSTAKQYDPLRAPDPQTWLAMEEADRITLVRDYHRRAGIKMPKQEVHATLHAVVENQLALGVEQVRDVLHRLMSEGLNRHDGIHAIGQTFLMTILYDSGRPAECDTTVSYFDALRSVSAKQWLNQEL